MKRHDWRYFVSVQMCVQNWNWKLFGLDYTPHQTHTHTRTHTHAHTHTSTRTHTHTHTRHDVNTPFHILIFLSFFLSFFFSFLLSFLRPLVLSYLLFVLLRLFFRPLFLVPFPPSLSAHFVYCMFLINSLRFRFIISHVCLSPLFQFLLVLFFLIFFCFLRHLLSASSFPCLCISLSIFLVSESSLTPFCVSIFVQTDRVPKVNGLCSD